MKRASLSRIGLALLCLGVVYGCNAGDAPEDVAGDGAPITAGATDVRIVDVPGTSIRVATWNDAGRPFFSIDLGAGFLPAKETSYEVPFRQRRVNPAAESKSTRPQGTALHLVQFISQPLEAFIAQVQAAGGEVHQYVHGNAYVVRGDAAAMARIEALPFVRAVSTLDENEKIDPMLRAVESKETPIVVLLVDGKRDRKAVESHITALGGTIDVSDPLGILIEAHVPRKSVEILSALPEVLWLEQGTQIENDYDIANQQGGQQYLESLEDTRPNLPGYTGVGIRGHILEGITPTHGDFVANGFRQAPIAVDNGNSDSHGMQTFGIVFGSGAGNARARGLLPNGQGYYTHNSAVMSAPLGGRSTLVGKLVNEHKVMFQTASWGQPTKKDYDAKSAEMDALIFLHDIPITQSQSNTGSQTSRPQAWAKNIISVGALNHYGTLTMDDDKWSRSGSIGPATDGRIKPDVCFYYDRTITTTTNGQYSQSFGGTSGATPTVAGHVGLAIELWTNGVFGNPISPRVDGEDVASWRFRNRPHASTTKALLVHTATQHQFEGENHDRTRTHQGWGIPNVEEMYKRRNNMLVVNETDVLAPLQKSTYTVDVAAGAPDLRATMVYKDKEATVFTGVHRINNLDLKVIAPNGTVYWGNNGLKASMYSTPGGDHNVVDTVENIIIKDPAAGRWTIEVIADEVNADSHPQTPALDADYALVVSY
ncbi:MAG: S8 family serine peptidase [Labilithrix sp.]|nr:S8 family serine peptidase [Labilithrix sp.]MCW5811980.1 S8 family serine peptidase [Labilithrix sp.]